MQVTYIGHATTLIELDGKHILTDPHFGNWLFLLPRQQYPGIRFHNLPKIDLALVSHAHYDHLHKRTLRKLHKVNPQMALRCARGIARIIKSTHITDVKSMYEDETDTVAGLKITAVRSKHFGGRLFLAGGFILGYTGFIIEGKEGTVYFPGDAAYSETYFTEIGQRFKIDIALLPIGAYKPRIYLRGKHMNPDDAIKAFQDLHARYMVPIHWGTFKLGLEFLHTPTRWLRELSQQYGVEDKVKILQFGETFSLEKP